MDERPKEYSRNLRLTTFENIRIDEALGGWGDLDDVLFTRFRIDVTRGDMLRLCPSVWLNDELINVWMELLNERTLAATGGVKRVHFFNTFFATKLAEGVSVRRWARRFDIFELDKLIVPVHVRSNHWCLAVVFVGEQRIQYYDSLGGGGMDVLNRLFGYLDGEMQARRGRCLNRGLWTLVPTTTTPKASCPQQNNGCDCGLFTCMAADYIANNQLDLAYDQGAMPAFRRRMAARIIAGTLDAEEARQPGAPLRSECL